MDILTYAAAKSAAKKYTDAAIAAIGGAGLKYKGAVDYYDLLPSDAEIGDCYTIVYKGTSTDAGTEEWGAEFVWGDYKGTEQWIELGSGTGLPDVSPADNGKFLGVTNGQWSKVDAPEGLPAVTTADNEKTLKVVGGQWSVVQGSDGVQYFSGSGAPGSMLVAKEGDIYRDTSTNRVYICTQYTDPTLITDLAGLTIQMPYDSSKYEILVNYPEDGMDDFYYESPDFNHYTKNFIQTSSDTSFTSTRDFYAIRVEDKYKLIFYYQYTNKIMVDATESTTDVEFRWNDCRYIRFKNPEGGFKNTQLIDFFVSNAINIDGVGSVWTEVQDKRISAYNSTYANNVTTIDSNGNIVYVNNTVGVPKPSTGYNGKFLGVNNDSLQYLDPIPPATSSDNDSILRVKNGQWTKSKNYIQGTTDPTNAIVASIGDLYINTTNGKVFVCTNYVDPNNITDLTGLTIYTNETFDITSNVYRTLYFSSNNGDYSKWGIYYDSDTREWSLKYGSNGETKAYVQGSGWTNENYRTIKVMGGTDATNTWLINWFITNATIDGMGSIWTEIDAPLPSIYMYKLDGTLSDPMTSINPETLWKALMTLKFTKVIFYYDMSGSSAIVIHKVADVEPDRYFYVYPVDPDVNTGAFFLHFRDFTYNSGSYVITESYKKVWANDGDAYCEDITVSTN